MAETAAVSPRSLTASGDTEIFVLRFDRTGY
jgi:hypothetical protein